jgi:hypothetical protein
MKRAIDLLVSGLVFFLAAQSFVAAQNDPPHNDSSGVACGDCHDSALLGQSPFWTDNQTETAYNSVCDLGHIAGGAPAGNVVIWTEDGADEFGVIYVECYAGP